MSRRSTRIKKTVCYDEGMPDPEDKEACIPALRGWMEMFTTSPHLVSKLYTFHRVFETAMAYPTVMAYYPTVRQGLTAMMQRITVELGDSIPTSILRVRAQWYFFVRRLRDLDGYRDVPETRRFR